MMASFLTVHWSGSSLVSPFVMNPSSATWCILWVIMVPGCVGCRRQYVLMQSLEKRRFLNWLQQLDRKRL